MKINIYYSPVLECLKVDFYANNIDLVIFNFEKLTVVLKLRPVFY